LTSIFCQLSGSIKDSIWISSKIYDSDMTAISPSLHARRWWDIPSAILLLAAVLTASIRLASTDWIENLFIIEYVAVIGLIAGLALGQSSFKRNTVLLFIAAYGLFIIGWQLGTLTDPGILWSERLASLGGRLVASTLQLSQRKPVTDPLLFLTVMTIIFWLLSTHAGYSLTRSGNIWQAALPIGLAMFVIHIQDPFWPYRAWFLAAYIFFSLLLLARVTYLDSNFRWQQSHTRLPPYLGLDLIRATLLATAILVLIAWTAPALASSVPLAERAWRQISRPWTVARSRMSNAFASLRASVGLVYDYYGDTLPLGRGSNLTDQIIMTIKAPPFPDTYGRFYWRARVYDTYEDGFWASNSDDSASLNPENFNLNFPDLNTGRVDATFDVTPWVPLSTLFVPPQPIWVSRPVQAEFLKNPDESVDLAALHANVNVQAGEVYEVRSSVSAVTTEELQQAGEDYPDWVRERYLQLPSTITQRTRDLAGRILSQNNTPYDRTIAVIDYLRENIRYTETVPTPPTGQDPVDWVLFDLRQGFCNYYSSSAIVLLRAMGIPARWAVGYAEGEYDLASNTYIVRQRDAHSWPEVFFPAIGWVEFEPTVIQPDLIRPVGAGTTVEPDVDLSGASGSGGEQGLADDLNLQGLERSTRIDLDLGSQNSTNPFITGGLALAALALIGVSLFAWRTRGPRMQRSLPNLMERGFRRFGITPPNFVLSWSRYASLPPIAHAYNEINKSLRRLGVQPGAEVTPAERATAIATLLPAAASPAMDLVDEYQSVTYGAKPGDLDTARRNARSVRNQSWLARLKRLFARLQAPVGERDARRKKLSPLAKK
jgi:transglutaminase-like putative cysteine protease